MSFDRFLTTLESIAASLAVMATGNATAAEATATLGEAETKNKGGRPKKNETPPAATTTSTPAPTPPAATPPAQPTGTTWEAALAKVQEVNNSKAAGCGRDGVMTIIEKFFPGSVTTDANGAKVNAKRVPDLATLNKHGEIVAFANTLLNPPANAGDDLGL